MWCTNVRISSECSDPCIQIVGNDKKEIVPHRLSLVRRDGCSQGQRRQRNASRFLRCRSTKGRHDCTGPDAAAPSSDTNGAREGAAFLRRRGGGLEQSRLPLL